MSRRTWLFNGLILVIVLLTFVWFAYRTTHRQVANPIKIGAVLPLTGEAAPIGDSARKAIDLAIDEINSAGGLRGRRMEVIHEDTKLQPKEAESAVTKLISIDKVSTIIGPMSSSEVEAVLPVCEKNQVVIVSPSATDHQLSGKSPFFFRTIVSDTYEGNAMAHFAFEKKGYRKLAIVYIESAGPFGISETVRKEFEALGGRVVTIEKGQQGTGDLRSQLTRVKSKHVDAVFFAGFPQETVTMLKQAKEIGLNVQILAHGTAEAPEVRQKAGSAAEGLIFATATLTPESGAESVRKFFEDYRRRYGSDPQTYAANAYDAAKLVARAIDEQGLKGSDIARGLRAVTNYQGATGMLSIEANGDVTQPVRIMTIIGGRVVPFTESVSLETARTTRVIGGID